MAKLHNYYVLCPLIDQKSFLGVSQDKDEEYVIVTLGRNVASRYRLSDEKQVGGWTSRDHITSAVIYDKAQDSYVGIFNNNIIKVWKEDVQNLDKVKKQKFPIHMLKLIPRPQSSLIIFTNGNCASLPYALENRKTYESKPLFKDTDVIVDTACYSQNGVDYICHVVKSAKDVYEIVNCPIREELGDLERSKLSKVQVSRSDDVYVVGQLICTLCTQEKATIIYFFWSDSKLTAYDLTTKSWKSIGNVPWISTFSTVSMAWMGKNHLILFGSNLDQDGAIIVAFNVTLGVGSCKYPMKMYSEGAKLYCFNSRIVLEASNHIAVIPYVLETKRNLSSLLGSHDIAQDECMELVNWTSSDVPLMKVADVLKDHLQQGLTERTICSQVVLPLLEKKDVRKLLKVLPEFKDIPESVQVQLVNYCMKLINASTCNITQRDQFIKFCTTNEEKLELLHFIFNLSFSDALLIPQLRNCVTLNNVLFLLRYITHLLTTSKMTIHCDYESKLLDWCTLLMDAFYPQFLITKDEKVTLVLKNTTDAVASLIQYQLKIDESMKMLNYFLNGKAEANDEPSTYFIETMII